MTKYTVYEDENHHLGIVSEDGKNKTPAVYDEIQIRDDGIWYCRAYTNWDYFYTSNCTFSLMFRKGNVKGANGKIVSNNSKYTSIEDREVYDSIHEWKTSEFIYTYEYGKFGLKALDGTVILDAIYDDIDVWRDANVIQVRIGEKHLYFNDKSQQILTDEPECKESEEPYCNSMGRNQVTVKEIVDNISDNHTYESKAGFVRINQQKVNDVALMLERNCERIPMSPEAIKVFTDQYSYEFGMTIIRLNCDRNGVICEKEWKSGVEKLDTLGAFCSSWHYIDKFVTNSKTMISAKSLYWLKNRYDMECDVLGDLCFAYGIDDSLPDNVVKWIHVEHYNEHCFPEDYGVCDTMRYDSLSELKKLIEAHDWKVQGDPYGGCFFGYDNICYPDERTWEETEKILNYMHEIGHNPEELTERVVEMLEYECDTPDEMNFWEKCVEWSLCRSEFPNKIKCGRTCYDKYLEMRIDSKPEEIQQRIKKLGKMFLAHGARTSIQQSEYYIQRMNNVSNPYDYSIIDTLK